MARKKTFLFLYLFLKGCYTKYSRRLKNVTYGVATAIRSAPQFNRIGIGLNFYGSVVQMDRALVYETRNSGSYPDGATICIRMKKWK